MPCPVSVIDFDSLVKKCIEYSFNHQSSYVCLANVHMCMEAHQNKHFNKVLEDADIVTADGMPIVLALKYLFGIKQERLAGMELLPALLKAAEEKDLTVFFYGGTEKMLQDTYMHIQKNHPKLLRHYYYNPPFRTLSAREELEVVKKINDTKAHLVFVILGCPKQEKWMSTMKGKINACMVGVGGALPVMTGMQKRAPKWMQKMSLEWLFRLIQEPKRLFKRYLVTNSFFVFLFFVDLLRVGLLKRNPLLISPKKK